MIEGSLSIALPYLIIYIGGFIYLILRSSDDGK